MAPQHEVPFPELSLWATVCFQYFLFPFISLTPVIEENHLAPDTPKNPKKKLQNSPKRGYVACAER